MRRTGVVHIGVLTFVVLSAATCASSGSSGGVAESPQGGANTVTIRVTNDMIPPTPITVWIIPETGSRRRLGTIEPNQQATFSFSPGIRSMEHRLVAERTGGSDVTTTPFTLDGVLAVRWTTSSAVVNLERGGD